MTITGDYLLIGLVVLALGLSFLALKVTLLVFRMGAAMTWLAIGILFWTNQLGTSLGDPWTQVLGFVFLVMCIGVLTLHMRTEIRHERAIRGSGERETSTKWVSKSKKSKSASERQAEYRDRLKEGRGR